MMSVIAFLKPEHIGFKISMTLVALLCNVSFSGPTDPSGRSINELMTFGNRNFRLQPTLRLSYPQIASINASFLLNSKHQSDSLGSFSGALLFIEPGYQGYKAGIGLGTIGEMGYAASARATYFSPWITLLSFSPNEKYLGAEVSLSGFLASYTFGIFTGMNKHSSPFVLSTGIGFGAF